jgi:hypothetical protein
VPISIHNNALGSGDSADNSAGNDGTKGNDDDVGNDENVVHMDDSNPVHNVLESGLVVFVDSCGISFPLGLIHIIQDKNVGH